MSTGQLSHQETILVLEEKEGKSITVRTTVFDDLLAAFGEFIGTFVFLFLALSGAQGALTLNGDKVDASALVAISTSFGLALVVGIAISAKLSGGHLNPAVTLALTATGHNSVLRAVFYIFAQLLGGVFAALFTKAHTPGQFMVANSIAKDVSIGSALVSEIILTFVLMATVYMVAVESTMDPGFAPLLIGFAVFVIHLAGVGISGCSVNPARTFGPALVSGNFANHWLYWIGPIVGALAASVWYRANQYAQIKKDQ